MSSASLRCQRCSQNNIICTPIPNKWSCKACVSLGFGCIFIPPIPTHDSSSALLSPNCVECIRSHRRCAFINPSSKKCIRCNKMHLLDGRGGCNNQFDGSKVEILSNKKALSYCYTTWQRALFRSFSSEEYDSRISWQSCENLNLVQEQLIWWALGAPKNMQEYLVKGLWKLARWEVCISEERGCSKKRGT